MRPSIMPTDTDDANTDAPNDISARFDPRGLIAEAFAIEGITEPDCRSIFFDWALGLDPSVAQDAAINALLNVHGAAPDGHPMRAVLLEGLGQRPGHEGGARRAGRRGGRARTEARRAEVDARYAEMSDGDAGPADPDTPAAPEPVARGSQNSESD